MTGLHLCRACAAGTRPRRIGITEMVVCPECGLGHLASPATGGTDDYWARAGDARAELDERYWTESRSAVFKGALRALAAEVGTGRVLDLGGGVGHFSELALAMGWDAYSADLSTHAVAAASARIGASRSFTAVPGELQGTFDAVTMWCVVAHVADPGPLLDEAMRLLRPGGCLLLSTPNFVFQARYAAVLARLGRPMDIEAQDHVLHFTPGALKRVLAGAGADRCRFTYLGVTEDCLFSRDMARWLVPAKRVWNTLGTSVTRIGLPPVGSELQVLARKAAVPAA